MEYAKQLDCHSFCNTKLAPKSFFDFEPPGYETNGSHNFQAAITIDVEVLELCFDKIFTEKLCDPTVLLDSTHSPISFVWEVLRRN